MKAHPIPSVIKKVFTQQCFSAHNYFHLKELSANFEEKFRFPRTEPAFRGSSDTLHKTPTFSETKRTAISSKQRLMRRALLCPALWNIYCDSTRGVSDVSRFNGRQ